MQIEKGSKDICVRND